MFHGETDLGSLTDLVTFMTSPIDLSDQIPILRPEERRRLIRILGICCLVSNRHHFILSLLRTSEFIDCDTDFCVHPALLAGNDDVCRDETIGAGSEENIEDLGRESLDSDVELALRSTCGRLTGTWDDVASAAVRSDGDRSDVGEEDEIVVEFDLVVDIDDLGREDRLGAR